MRKEGPFESYAWVILFVLSAFWAIRGLIAMLFGGALFDSGLHELTGKGWNDLIAESPAMATFINATEYEGGAFGVGFGLLGMAISSTGYRRGERTAWYAAWVIAMVPLMVFPLALGANTPFGAVVPPHGKTAEGGSIALFSAIYSVLIVLTLLGLILPYRKFFPHGSN
jgi:hypothetical protein